MRPRPKVVANEHRFVYYYSNFDINVATNKNIGVSTAKNLLSTSLKNKALWLRQMRGLMEVMGSSKPDPPPPTPDLGLTQVIGFQPRL